MLKALGLSKSTEPVATAEEKTAQILNEVQDFELTLRAMDYVLDDRAEEGINLIKAKQDEHTIFKLGLGVVEFLEATLGFEPETMRKAFVTLQLAETMSLRDRAKFQKNKLKTSSVYPPGTEYAVMYAESNLLSALIMLLSESVIESAKALYKLRKAYHTLDEINRTMLEYLTPLLKLQNPSTASFGSTTSTTSFADIPFPLSDKQMSDTKLIARVDKVFQMRRSRIRGAHIGNSPLVDRLRSTLGVITKGTAIGSGSASPENAVSDTIASQNATSENATSEDSASSETSASAEVSLEFDIDNDKATIDEFIHSGVNLCFGILQVVLLLIPPAIGKVLLVVGFKGSREQGLKMLWEAANERNIHGGIALLALLVFYDGPFQFTDLDFDVPDSLPGMEGLANDDLAPAKSVATTLDDEMTLVSVLGVGGGVLGKTEDDAEADDFYSVKSNEAIPAPGPHVLETYTHTPLTLLRPGIKLETALLRARALFPNSALWLLQEGRMLASQGKLAEAVAIMSNPAEIAHIQMKQVEALLIYDRAMILLFLHEYERAAADFLLLVEKNAWSHGLYTYFAGCCYLEIYRMLKLGIYTLKSAEDLALSKVEAMVKYRKLAETTILEAPLLVGKKKFLAKTMPFDKFLLRKIDSFEKTQKAYKLASIVDAVGVSPIHELKYFWNGYNRMPRVELEISLRMLGYSGAVGTAFSLNDSQAMYPLSFPESKDDAMIRYTLQAIALRRLGYIQKGQRLVDTKVIPQIMTSPALAPAAQFHFHKLTHDPWLYPAVFYERALFTWKLQGECGLKEAKEWLKRAEVVGEGDYELSTRTSMKIKAAVDRLNS
ncbi:hypothetical protein BABINDRAFT_6841 [Babjeviella inositovora NRRL Y-12698]|uniref:Inclusion body clearance protein IML2 n=1 Tax=Babjeviella inositovora NRRL Y-12698 TaxID=984486 RepID=A0A1E3QTV7_9ASCO|nr:uncharacterized protein BABINDRAFT_6841 [Babjeviella inositovora NRRL Y-12698]ODQ80984.1 hypothetical protein BABINDRAFT_6841 [Babjeviella inositovora NRRL Y-12698]